MWPAIPMRAMQLENFVARCEAQGVSPEATLFPLAEGRVDAGDQVLVRVGDAIPALSKPDAKPSTEFFDISTADRDRLNS